MLIYQQWVQNVIMNNHRSDLASIYEKYNVQFKGKLTFIPKNNFLNWKVILTLQSDFWHFDMIKQLYL